MEAASSVLDAEKPSNRRAFVTCKKKEKEKGKGKAFRACARARTEKEGEALKQEGLGHLRSGGEENEKGKYTPVNTRGKGRRACARKSPQRCP